MDFLQEVIDKEYPMSSTILNDETKIRFSPAVYEQRYHRVADILSNGKIQKNIRNIVEFGVAEMKSFVIMKNCLPNVQRIDLVDIDEELLGMHCRRVDPLIAEHLTRRETELTVNVWKGSVSVANPNLKDVDAVIAIELIEHVFPDVIEEIPYNIFHEINPRIAIFSTPNADFNELFDMAEGTFRHYDHKFEWTREEFQDWANNICTRYPDYSVIFTGIGSAPEGFDHLGCCSQMAVFIRKDFAKYLETYDENHVIIEEESSENESTPLIESHNDYKLIHSVTYPFFKDKRTFEEKLIDEIEYLMNCRKYDDDYINYEADQIEIPFEHIAGSCYKITEDFDIIKKIVEKKYTLKNGHFILPQNQTESDNDEDCETYENSNLETQ